MNTYFTSDLHFGHKKITQLSNRWRFTTAEDHDQWMIDLHNSQVQENDIVYVLGDFSFYKYQKTKEILEQLNGNIIIIKGNHDEANILSRFEEEGLIYYWEHYNEIYLYDDENEKQKACLMHFPIACWNKQHYGSFMLHAHSHGNYEAEGKILDVGIDSAYNIFGEHRYFRVSDIFNYMKDREIKVNDHHQIR